LVKKNKNLLNQISSLETKLKEKPVSVVDQVKALLPKVIDNVEDKTLKEEVNKLLENITKLKECIICFQPIEHLQDYSDLKCDHN